MLEYGILLHVRHLETMGWERLMWGEPKHNKLGSLSKLVELILTEANDQPITTIVLGCGPSHKDGLTESAYTKKYLLDRFNRLPEFDRINKYWQHMSDQDKARLYQRLQDIIETPIRNTDEEVVAAARIFTERGVDKVIQVAMVSHAPRCLQAQTLAREKGIILPEQTWSVVADDMLVEGTSALTTLILEKPHRGDDPMLGIEPSAPEVLRGYLKLSTEDKKKFLRLAQKLLS